MTKRIELATNVLQSTIILQLSDIKANLVKIVSQHNVSSFQYVIVWKDVSPKDPIYLPTLNIDRTGLKFHFN